MKNFLIFILVLIPIFLQAQVQSKITWLSDSIALGYPTPLSYSIRYPIGYTIIFPDSTKDFVPFELHSKKYFLTQIEDNYAKDSVIYYLTSFQIDSIQKIQLPYSYVFRLDTTHLKSDVASIPFQRKVFDFSDKTPYLIHTELYKVPIEPDYALWFGLTLISLFLISLVIIFFRKKIMKWLILRKIQYEWKTIQNQLDLIFEKSDVKNLIYELNQLWKNYLGVQNSVQPASLTLKEFQIWIENFPLLENKQLFIELCQLEDRIFYASEKIDKQIIFEKKETLKLELQKVYLKKRKEISI